MTNFDRRNSWPPASLSLGNVGIDKGRRCYLRWLVWASLSLVVLYTALSHAAVEDCAKNGNGGMAICTDPVPVPAVGGAPHDGEMWSYADCDNYGAYLYRSHNWCTVLNGTWMTPW